MLRILKEQMQVSACRSSKIEPAFVIYDPLTLFKRLASAFRAQKKEAQDGRQDASDHVALPKLKSQVPPTPS